MPPLSTPAYHSARVAPGQAQLFMSMLYSKMALAGSARHALTTQIQLVLTWGLAGQRSTGQAGCE